MKHLMAFVLVCGIAAMAAVGVGENLMLNGNFEGEQLEVPAFWQFSGEHLTFLRTGAPDKTGALHFESTAPADAFCRQQGLNLVEGEAYKVSVMIRTVNFKARRANVCVINTGWFTEQGIGPKDIPENTNGWKKIEVPINKLAKSKDGEYGIVLFAMGYTGILEIANARLEAVSQKALAGSSPSSTMEDARSPRLIPWEPLLDKIPKSNPVMTFLFTGALEGGPGKYTVRFQVDGKWKTAQPVEKLVRLNLAGEAVGEHQILVSLQEKASGKRILERSYHSTICEDPRIDTTGHRRLNNYVTEILSKEIQGKGESCRFYNPRDGWVFIAVSEKQASEEMNVRLDGKDLIITGDTPRHEAFRNLSAGRHELTLANLNPGAKLVVRSISEIFNYPLCANSQVPQNGSYGWEFHEKYVFQAVTTLNGGTCPEEHQAKIRQKGLLWLANLGTTSIKDADDLLKRLTNSNGMNKPVYDGLTCDEQFFVKGKLSAYTEGLWKYDNPNNKLIYTWIVGGPSAIGAHNEFISASLNVSRGRGRLIYEAYCHSLPTEADAKAYLEKRFVTYANDINRFFPNAIQGSGILLGNFNQIPIISLDVRPDVDYKYYLDMQLNLLANHSAFAGIATAGYWGSYYDDEELYRWSFSLLRHYCVEGRTELLSKDAKFGYKYNLTYLKNCDFDEKLDNWTCQGAVSTDSHSGYGSNSQARWGGGNKVGSNFCVMERKDGAANTVSQLAKGLIPGKVYTLQFVTGDVDDIKASVFAPKKIGVTASIESAELVPGKSYTFVDRRASEKAKKSARVNLNYIRFIAKAPEAKITFTDKDAPVGQKSALNYIMLKPYFEN